MNHIKKIYPGLVGILILTRNEECHIARCISSALKISRSIYVVDSNSVDNTQKIASDMGAHVLSGDFKSFSEKLNWSLSNIDFEAEWIVRLDADEVFSNDFVQKIESFLLELNLNTTGAYVRRQLCFMGSRIRYGGLYPSYSMRIWRAEVAYCENRDLDEHMILRYGKSVKFEADIIDDPLITLTSWVAKHNEYSSLEADLTIRASMSNSINEIIEPRFFGESTQRTRWLKLNVFYRLPIFIRPFLYFFYRYFLRLGFMDGREGFIFHFMHGLWYRLLVDAKILELKLKRITLKDLDRR